MQLCRCHISKLTEKQRLALDAVQIVRTPMNHRFGEQHQQMFMPNLCPLLAGPLLTPLTGDPKAEQGAHLNLSGP